MQSTKLSHHLPWLDGLRALAALYVVLHHAMLTAQHSAPASDRLTLAFFRLFAYGHYAVALFIVLSGFCLMLPVLRDNGTLQGGSWQFYRRRARRMLPAYIAAIGVSLLLIATVIGRKTGTLWDMSLPVTVKSVLSHLLMLHDVVGDSYTINGVLWSVAVEWRICVLFPLLVWSWRRIGPALTTVMSLLFSYIGFILAGHFFGTTGHTHYLGLFTLGMWGAAVAFGNDATAVRLRGIRWGWIAAGGWVAFVAVLWQDSWPMHLTDYLISLVSVALLIAAAQHRPTWLTATLAWRPLVWIGTFGYSLYLMHLPILQLTWQYLLVPLHGRSIALFMGLLGVGVPLVVLGTYGFYLVCERPFLRRRTHANPSRPQPLPQVETS